MTSFRDRKLRLAFSSSGARQSAMGVPMPNAAHDKAFPLTTRAVPGRTITRDETRDCGGEYIVGTKITSRLARYSTPFDLTPSILAAILPYLFGVAAAPVGVPANEQQTITVDATGGTFTAAFTFEGLTGTTAAIAYNATAAQLKTALEGLRSIKTGNVTVGKVGSVFTVTFTGKLAKANVPLLVTNAASLTGGAQSAVVATTVAGANNAHTVTRQTADQMAVTSMIIGFEGDANPPQIYRDMALNSLTLSVARRQKATATAEWIGSMDVEAADGFALPACYLPVPIYAEDCRVTIDGTIYTEDLDSAEYTASANILSGDSAFPFDDIDVYALEHGDRTSGFKFSIYGSQGDALYALALAESIVPVRFDFGPAGDRISIIAPRCQVRLSDSPLSFTGDASKSAIQIEAVPLFDVDNAGTTPDYVIMYNDQTVAYLQVGV